MGASFTNYQVRGKSASEVANAIAPLVEARAYVSPEKGGWVSVYDEGSELPQPGHLFRGLFRRWFQEGDEILDPIARGLSQKLGTVVFAFLVSDSDIARYWLYQNGNLLDEFDSAPDYFKKVSDKVRLRVRGNADKLLPLCVPGTARSQLDEILHPADSFPVMAEDIVTDLAKLLGIDETRISLGFTYFDEDAEEMLDDAPEFIPIGKGTDKKEKLPPVPDEEPSPVDFDAFPTAIWTMTRCWTGEHEKMADQSGGGADQAAQHFLKHSHLRGIPTFEELKAARDQGPEALAKLLVQRTPTELGSIADRAIQAGLVAFVAALLAYGMDPNTSNQHGESLLSVAEAEGKTEIYNLLKSALDKKR